MDEMTNVDLNNITAEQLAYALERFANNSRTDKQEELADNLCRNHRTHQQSMFGLFIVWCKKLSENKKQGFYDARNEKSCEVASQVMDYMEGYTSLPYI
jgi:hypothetical protein